MNGQGYFLRRAIESDLPEIMRMIDYARERMLAEGKCQWDENYPQAPHILEDIRLGHAMLLCSTAGIPLTYGAIVLGDEPAYKDLRDGAWLTEEGTAYGVVHRLAAAPEARGKGCGSEFMLQAEALMRDKGMASFRVDTNFDNDAMLHILDKLGFSYCGKVMYGHGERLAYEKIL